jgi:dihydroorotate dehydrogenase
VPPVRWAAARWLAPRDPVLRVSAFGLELPSPLGLAAGFDKDARHVEALGALGFGFVEVGTVTAVGQPGNPRPRMFRLPADHALVNRMGFNNDGASATAQRLAAVRSRWPRGGRRAASGVNIGKTKVVPAEEAAADYRASAERLAPLADYLVVNVSSPNTPGLRDLQAVEQLRPILTEVQAAAAAGGRPVPVLVKIAPDLADADIDAVADLALAAGLDGIVATNTTTAREALSSDPAAVQAAGAGGLSGAPLRERSLEVLRRLRARVGEDLLLVSVGGIETPEDAFARLQAGATLVQAYTAFVYGGPLWPARMNRGLARLLRDAGAGPVADIGPRVPDPAEDASSAVRRT